MAGSQYPKEMPSPDGFTLHMAYSAEDEGRLHERFQAFRDQHQAANRAALEGKDAPKSEQKKGA